MDDEAELQPARGNRSRSITKTTLIGMSLLVVAALASSPWWLDVLWKSAVSGPPHTFELESAPDVLSEGLALETAQAALRLDGFDPTDWIPTEDNRSAVKYFLRNTINPNQGSIQFIRRDRKVVRSVNIELQDDHIVAQVWLCR